MFFPAKRRVSVTVIFPCCCAAVDEVAPLAASSAADAIALARSLLAACRQVNRPGLRRITMSVCGGLAQPGFAVAVHQAPYRNSRLTSPRHPCETAAV